MQTGVTPPGSLLLPSIRLSQVGWSRQPLLDCKLEDSRFYALRPLHRLRFKRWDYYAVFTPRRFFSANIAALGYAGNVFVYTPPECLGSLDWGRGVWEYRSFWNWASTSGYLPDGRTLGLNLGCGFGDVSAATEDCLILNGRIHKLERVEFAYNPRDYRQPWRFHEASGRLAQEFTPFLERSARTDLGLIISEVHQLLGHYSGWVQADDGERLQIEGLVGFAEEHRARW